MAFSGNLALAGLGATHLALIRRDLRFRTHAGIGVLANLCAVFVGILAAWFGLGYWSLVLMGVANNAFTTGAAWICSGWLPNAPKVEGIPGHGPDGAVPEWHRVGLLDDQSG